MTRFALAALLTLLPTAAFAQFDFTTTMGMTQFIIQQSAIADDPPAKKSLTPARKPSGSWADISVTREDLAKPDRNGCRVRIHLTDGRATTERLAEIYKVPKRCVVGGE